MPYLLSLYQVQVFVRTPKLHYTIAKNKKTTLKEISEVLGKETIDLYNQSENRGRDKSYGTNYQKTGKELMSQDELAVMDGSKCILQLRGVRPFLSDKYDITKHENYRYLSDYNKKNKYDIDKLLNSELKLKKDEIIEVYESVSVK